jgi:signal transduction histidine kinase
MAQAKAAGVTLSAEIGEPPLIAEIDPSRIQSVIGNLLSNALRHTPPGGLIKVDLERSNGQAVITVADDGEGIPPELLPHVFERFVKGASSPGSGLGLAIAQDIVRAHGGKLAIESQSGSGTHAIVTLPAAPASGGLGLH